MKFANVCHRVCKWCELVPAAHHEALRGLHVRGSRKPAAEHMEKQSLSSSTDQQCVSAFQVDSHGYTDWKESCGQPLSRAELLKLRR